VADKTSTLRRGPDVQTADNGKATLVELGLDRRRLSESRKVKQAGVGTVIGAIDGAVADGRAPTRADINRAVPWRGALLAFPQSRGRSERAVNAKRRRRSSGGQAAP
jgi:hypothetical protein